MGAWGEGTFENDAAVDWTYQLEDVDDLSIVEAALDAAIDLDDEDDEGLDADLGSEALAACEVIARLQGRFRARDAYSETVDRWVEAHPKLKPPTKLVRRADKAIERVLAEDSELRQLWEESGPEKWLAAAKDLRRRVKG